MTLSTLAERSLPALCYSLIFVKESHVQTPHSSHQNGSYVKSIIGKPFCGESDRLTSTILMALRQDEMKAQIERDWVTYSCRPLRKGKSNQLFLLGKLAEHPPADSAEKQAAIDSGVYASSSSSPTKKAVQSPSVTRGGAASSTLHIMASLPSEQAREYSFFFFFFMCSASSVADGSHPPVCVLDGRDRTFEINNDLHILATKLPPFTSEIPYGSVAMVTYTVSTWGQNNLNFSLNWIVLIASPLRSLTDAVFA
jgi:hypothetical protein